METIDLNFHILVIILIIITYIILKRRKKKNYYYILLVPIVMYGGNYLLKEKEINNIEIKSDNSSILKIPYPMSESSSSSNT